MSKLLKLKKWLTLPDAAKYLTCTFEEEVTEAHILRFALDGQLRLSIQLVNGAHARPLTPISISDLKYKEVVGLDGKLIKLHIGGPVQSFGKGVFQISEFVTPLDAAVWNLPLFDHADENGARLDIEHKYQMLTGGVAVTTVNIDGNVIVGDLIGGLYQLQEDFDDNEYQAGSNAQREKLEQHIADENIGAREAERLLDQHAEERKEFLAERKSRPANSNYYPSGRLPEDSVLVVRTDELREFEASINGAPESTEKPISTKERNTLLVIIAALAREAKINLSKPSKAAGLIEEMTETMGARVDHATIEQKIKQIPDALERRTK